MRKGILGGFLLGILLIASACAQREMPRYSGEFNCKYEWSTPIEEIMQSTSDYHIPPVPRWKLELLYSSLFKIRGRTFVKEEGFLELQATGFVIRRGEVVTAAHVVVDEDTHSFRRDAYFFVENFFGERSKVLPLERDERFDLALLLIWSFDVGGQEIPVGDPFNLKEGDPLYAVGYIGDMLAVGKGSFLGFICGVQERFPPYAIVISVGASNGVSGGPVLNRAGEVVGVIVKGGERYLLAVPINFAVDFFYAPSNPSPEPLPFGVEVRRG